MCYYSKISGYPRVDSLTLGGREVYMLGGAYLTYMQSTS